MKRIWLKEEGVSPVIATILMVAITVVLAAVLFVMVSTFFLTGAIPKIGWHPAKVADPSAPNNYHIEISSVENIDPTKAVLTDFKVTVEVNGTQVLTATGLSGFPAAGVALSGGAGTLKFADRDPGGRLNGGDKFVIENTLKPRIYEITISYKGSACDVKGTITTI